MSSLRSIGIGVLAAGIITSPLWLTILLWEIFK